MILDQDISQLSGGQLQRLAVAIAAAKEADYYFFDEPASYNDIYQRIALARVIHGLAAEQQKSVIVAEHDLALLDYISDCIHIIYGEPSAYGIVSSLQSTKIGINNFLEGFIQSENVRFREKAFEFNTSGSCVSIRNDPIAGYSNIIKSFSSFKLKVASGYVNREEIVGVLGANGLGKTTFMRMLSGVEKIDEGIVDNISKISYKPQYLSPDYDGNIRSLLSTAYLDTIEGSPVEEQIVIPLGIEKIYEKNVKQISGGELQKVAIALCLLHNADIYALDEPSAFLDIEDRITVANLLQRFVRSQGKSAIITEHDLQLMDLVADSIIIFEGYPSLKGCASSPMSKEEGMNRFLRMLSITFRREQTTGRPRVNNKGSRLDREQKEAGKYYYRNN
jgi:ATP-binding cassette, sub-family E, member 1